MSLYVQERTGVYRLASPREIQIAARQCAATFFKRGFVANNPNAVKAFLSDKLRAVEHELFACLFLDQRHRLIAYEELFRGSIDGASVYPREVMRRVLAHNAAALILAHNHPSGDSSPSDADRRITTRIKDGLALIDVRVLDHIVVGEDTCSFAETGLL